MNCPYYDKDEIVKNYPLKKCAGCSNNIEVDGLYTCQVSMDEICLKLSMERKGKSNEM